MNCEYCNNTGKYKQPKDQKRFDYYCDHFLEGDFCSPSMAEEKAYKEEKNSFTKREKAVKTQADNLFNYLQNMLAGENFKSSKVSVTYRSSKSVECDDISKVPDYYLRPKDPDIDRVAIKKAIEDGEEVAGCRLVVNKNMQIK